MGNAKPKKNGPPRGMRQIRAAAGSGKTYELTASFLAALAHCGQTTDAAPACGPARRGAGAALSELLAITFTNAAAAEMRQRVIQRLKQSALGLASDLEPQAAEKWLAKILGDMKSLNIRTIDSLLHLIVRSSSLELGLDPEFEPGFSTGELFKPVIEKYIDHAAIDGKGRAELEKALGAAIDYGDAKGFTRGSKLVDRLSSVLEEALLGVLDNLSPNDQVRGRLQEITEAMRNAAQAFLAETVRQGLILNGNALTAFNEYARGKDKESVFSKKDSALDLLNKGKSPKPSNVQALEALYQDFKPKYLDFAASAETLRKGLELGAFVELAKDLAFFFSQVEPGALPAALIPALASRALQSETGVSDALCHLGTRLTHFLVDEFQDTSVEQWNVLRSFAQEGLSRGGSLAWVGDVKQSIYGFRGGDSSLFDAILDDAELTAIAPEPATDGLRKNWRSKRAVVNHNNTVFSLLGDSARARKAIEKLLPQGASPRVLEGAAASLCRIYNKEDVWQECAAKDDPVEGYVATCVIDGDNAAEINEKILDSICALLLKDIHKRHAWSDALILCRGNEGSRKVAEALIKAGIPVVTENSLLLAERPLIIQAQAFLEFMANPADDLAFWTFVSGSAFLGHPAANGLEASALTDWLCGKNPGSQPLHKEFAKDFPAQWDALIAPFFAGGALFAPYDLIREWFFWLDLEARYPEERIFLRRFLEVVHAAERNGHATISTFLDYWRGHGGEEKAPLPQGMDAVRIMTIHKAKGLEAPVVIVPWTDFIIKAPDKTGVIETAGLRVATLLNRKAAGERYYQELAKQALESINLLYVALTRARDELYIYLPRKGRGPKTLQPVVEALLLESGFGLNYTRGSLPDGPAQERKEEPEEKAPAASPLEERGNWRPMGWMPRLNVFRAHPDTPKLTPSERGVFIHYCLEKLVFHGDPDKDAENALQFGFKHSGIPIPEDAELRRGLLDAVRWYAGLSQAPRWLRDGWPEQALVDAEGRLMRADLLVPHGGGLLVIDYKTGQEHPEHVSQLQRYMACLKESGQFTGKLGGLLIYLDLRAFKEVWSDGASGLTAACPAEPGAA